MLAAMPRQTRPRPTQQPLTFRQTLELIRSVEKMAFGEPPRTFRAREPSETNTLYPASFHYRQSRPSLIWRKVGPEKRQRARGIIDAYFPSLIDSPAQHVNLLFFRGYEQQGTNFLTKILPTYKVKLGDPPWSTVVATLGTLISTEQKVLRYDRNHSGTIRRSSHRGAMAGSYSGR
jgi:hypothetical protein